MLVACQLVNRASWAVAEAVLADLRRAFPDPGDLAAASPEDVRRKVKALGFQTQRGMTLPAFAAAWQVRRPVTREDVLEMPGCGRYAADSWAIFVEGRDVTPTDGRLLFYVTGGREGRGR